MLRFLDKGSSRIFETMVPNIPFAEIQSEISGKKGSVLCEFVEKNELEAKKEVFLIK